MTTIFNTKCFLQLLCQTNNPCHYVSCISYFNIKFDKISLFCQVVLSMLGGKIFYVETIYEIQ